MLDPIVTRLLVRGPRGIVGTLPLMMMPAAMAGLAVSLVKQVPHSAQLVGLGAAAFWLVKLLTADVNGWNSAKPRAIVVGEDGITVDGQIIPRAQLAEGWFQPGGAADVPPSVVIVDTRHRPLFHAVVTDEAQANDILRLLGLDRGAVRFRASLPYGDAIWIALFAVLFFIKLLLDTRGLERFTPLLLLAMPFAVLFSIPARIEVAASSVTYRWLRWSRTYALADIADIQAQKQRLRIELRDGSVHELITGADKQHGEDASQHRDAIMIRINAGRRVTAPIRANLS